MTGTGLRERLPTRRPNVTRELTWAGSNGQATTCTVMLGFRLDGTPAEIFIDGAKIGSTMNISCRHDPGGVGVILISLARLPSPLSFPTVTGQLEVNVGNLIFPVHAGPISVTDGRYRLFPIPVPNIGTLAGFTFYAQTGAQSGSLNAISSLTTVQLVP